MLKYEVLKDSKTQQVKGVRKFFNWGNSEVYNSNVALCFSTVERDSLIIMLSDMPIDALRTDEKTLLTALKAVRVTKSNNLITK